MAISYGALLERKEMGRKVGSITVFSFDVYFGGPFQGTGRPVRPPPCISRG